MKLKLGFQYMVKLTSHPQEDMGAETSRVRGSKPQPKAQER